MGVIKHIVYYTKEKTHATSVFNTNTTVTIDINAGPIARGDAPTGGLTTYVNYDFQSKTKDVKIHCLKILGLK